MNKKIEYLEKMKKAIEMMMRLADNEEKVNHLLDLILEINEKIEEIKKQNKA